MCAIGSTTGNEVDVKRRSLGTSRDGPTRRGVHERLAREAEVLLTFRDRVSRVVEALNGIPVVPAIAAHVDAVPKPALVIRDRRLGDSEFARDSRAAEPLLEEAAHPQRGDDMSASRYPRPLRWGVV